MKWAFFYLACANVGMVVGDALNGKFAGANAFAAVFIGLCWLIEERKES